MTAKSNDEKLDIRGLKLERGTKSRTRIKALELADGSAVEIPVHAIRGSKPGPVFYLGSAFHGDEVNGVHVTSRLSRELDPRDLSGTLIIVPAQNPSALQVQHRYYVGHVLRSPLEQSPADPWASFPGDPNGNMASQIAHALFSELMRNADYLVDMHTPTSGGRYAPFAFLPPTRVGAIVEESERLAKAFGADFVLATNDGVYVQETNPHTVMARGGRIALGLEVGEGGQLDNEVTARGVRGLKNMLRSVGMLAGAQEEFGRKHVVSSMTPVRATRGGLLDRLVSLNDDVRKGQLVGTITDLFGDVVEEIRAPHDGPVVRITTFPSVASGERVVQLGVAR